jgi:two-component system OmpR family response regulator
VRILIAEDDSSLRTFFARALTEEGYVVDVCRTGGEAVEKSGRVAYDLILLDWMLPEGDGLSVCRSLRRGGTRVPIMMLTARSEVGEKVLALNAGADDYVTKPFHLAELLARVRSLLRRSGEVRAGILRVGHLTLDLRHRVLWLGGRKIELSGRELGLLELLMRHAGRVVTQSEILDHIRAMHLHAGGDGIEGHVRCLREKLGDTAPALETVRGKGYRLVLSRDDGDSAPDQHPLPLSAD